MTAAHQASLSFTISHSLLKLTSIELVTLSNHLILYCLLLPSILPSIGFFSNELALRIRWPKYWSFRFSISPSNEYSGLISLRTDWFDCCQSESCSVMSNSLWPHGLYSPWNSPDQNTGVGNLSLLQGIFPTHVPCTPGRFFTSWATREVQEYWSG